MPKTGAGNYDKYMTLMKPSLGTASETGEQIVAGTELAKMWCSLRPIRGREYYAAAQSQAETTHIIKTWYRSDITPDTTMWLMYGSRRFDIESAINVDEANVEFEFRVHEHAD